MDRRSRRRESLTRCGLFLCGCLLPRGILIEVRRSPPIPTGYICAFLMVLSLATLGPAVFTPTLYKSGDTILQYRWAYQFTAAFREGVIYPRWAAMSWFGL